MASEVLAIPEEHVLEVVAVIREGLCAISVDDEVYERLTEWCDREENYMLNVVGRNGHS